MPNRSFLIVTDGAHFRIERCKSFRTAVDIAVDRALADSDEDGPSVLVPPISVSTVPSATVKLTAPRMAEPGFASISPERYTQWLEFVCEHIDEAMAYTVDVAVAVAEESRWSDPQTIVEESELTDKQFSAISAALAKLRTRFLETLEAEADVAASDHRYLASLGLHLFEVRMRGGGPRLGTIAAESAVQACRAYVSEDVALGDLVAQRPAAPDVAAMQAHIARVVAGKASMTADLEAAAKGFRKAVGRAKAKKKARAL